MLFSTPEMRQVSFGNYSSFVPSQKCDWSEPIKFQISCTPKYITILSLSSTTLPSPSKMIFVGNWKAEKYNIHMESPDVCMVVIVV